MPGSDSANEPLIELEAIARELGADHVVSELHSTGERLAEGRFFVACIGQFKRGKSTFLNALVGADVLPVGVVPITAAMTVLRYGTRLRAVVRFASGELRDVDLASLSAFVSEAENPENAKGVTGAEVFVPSGLLQHGMCLVDTPGIGSPFEGNTETTRALVRQIDAALVVVGADPPISGAEIELIQRASEHIDRLVVVLNKAELVEKLQP